MSALLAATAVLSNDLQLGLIRDMIVLPLSDIDPYLPNGRGVPEGMGGVRRLGTYILSIIIFIGIIASLCWTGLVLLQALRGKRRLDDVVNPIVILAIFVGFQALASWFVGFTNTFLGQLG